SGHADVRVRPDEGRRHQGHAVVRRQVERPRRRSPQLRRRESRAPCHRDGVGRIRGALHRQRRLLHVGATVGTHADGRRPMGALREAASLVGVGATIVAMLCLSVFAWTTIRAAGSATGRVHDATAAAARYDSAAGAVERVQTIETRYAFSPSSGAAAGLGRAQRALDGSIAALESHATTAADRAAATRLATEDGVLDATLTRLHAAVAQHDAGTVGGLE